MNREVEVCCYATISVVLEILGRRDDGFHEIMTVMQTVDLADELRVFPAADGPCRVTGMAVPLEGNLCARALAAYREAFPGVAEYHWTLHKRIPAGAGLGGGSSDAAGMLVALHRLCGRGEAADLHAIAADLGSDVPFFLHGGTALAGGRGERLEPVTPLHDSWLVLARPDFGVNTATAYKMLKPHDFSDGSHVAALVHNLRRGCALHETAPALYNTFARPVEQRWPAIRGICETLAMLGAGGTLLSGSGSAVFGVFVDEQTARMAAARMTGDGLWAAAVSTVPCGVRVRDTANE